MMLSCVRWDGECVRNLYTPKKLDKTFGYMEESLNQEYFASVG